MDDIISLIIFLTLTLIGYIAGKAAEKKHYKDIAKREKLFQRIPAVTMKNVLDPSKVIVNSTLVSGSVVISIDYFKRLLAQLVNIFGGEMSSYESLVDRARREAILRMKEQCPKAHIITNLRIETSSIGRSANSKKSVGSVEAIAYGTAITYSREAVTSESAVAQNKTLIERAQQQAMVPPLVTTPQKVPQAAPGIPVQPPMPTSPQMPVQPTIPTQDPLPPLPPEMNPNNGGFGTGL